MSALDKTVEAESRHAIYLQRFAGGMAKDIEPYLEQLKKQIRYELLTADETMHRGRKLNRLLKRVSDIQKGIYGEYTEAALKQLELFAEHEIDFELGSINNVVLSGSVELSAPAVTQVWAAATANPLIFPDSNDNIMLRSYMKDWTLAQSKKVSSIISNGFAMGETNQQIAQKITGKGRHIDKKVRARNKQIVRTAIAHVSTVARHKTMEENDDIVIGYQWIATLDGRTSNLCKNLDGEVFLNKDNGYKPKPPLHPNERSVTGPIVDKRYQIDDGTATRASKGAEGGKQVKTTSTYYSWLKTQPASFQDDTLGKTRGALFRNGGLSSEEFKNLTTDQKFRPINLDEMRKKNPQAFEEAGL